MQKAVKTDYTPIVKELRALVPVLKAIPMQIEMPDSPEEVDIGNFDEITPLLQSIQTSLEKLVNAEARELVVPLNIRNQPIDPTAFILSSAAGTNATNIKATTGTLYQITCSNVGAAAAFVKLFNTAAAPTVGTTVPALTMAVPANGVPLNINFDALGMRFSAGISLSITNLVADSDATAVAAAQIKIMATYV